MFTSTIFKSTMVDTIAVRAHRIYIGIYQINKKTNQRVVEELIFFHFKEFCGKLLI